MKGEYVCHRRQMLVVEGEDVSRKADVGNERRMHAVEVE